MLQQGRYQAVYEMFGGLVGILTGRNYFNYNIIPAYPELKTVPAGQSANRSTGIGGIEFGDLPAGSQVIDGHGVRAAGSKSRPGHGCIAAVGNVHRQHRVIVGGQGCGPEISCQKQANANQGVVEKTWHGKKINGERAEGKRV